MKESLPKVSVLKERVLEALQENGGEASLQEMEERLQKAMGLSDEQMSFPHEEGKARPEIEYRLAWARTKLRDEGRIERVGKGIWRIRKPSP